MNPNFSNVVRAGMFAMMISGPAWAASEFEGVWKVTDTTGKAYEITLAPDGSANGTQEAGQAGTWKAEGEAVVIEWKSGWTTKISKSDGGYVKTAFKKGEGDGKPGKSSPAEKVK
ncbi:MAG: hypothetical protein ACT4N2_03530 [Hyphomicrobium sp.]